MEIKECQNGWRICGKSGLVWIIKAVNRPPEYREHPHVMVELEAPRSLDGAAHVSATIREDALRDFMRV